MMDMSATPSTIKIGRLEYTVAKQDNGQYILTGKRGAVYGTMRHYRQTDRMFLVSGGSGMPHKNVWLTDADGTLKMVGA